LEYKRNRMKVSGLSDEQEECERYMRNVIGTGAI